MGKLPIEYHPAARYEALEAFDWYLDRSVVVGARFQHDLESAQAKIQESPESWAVYLHGTRDSSRPSQARILGRPLGAV